MPAQPLVTQEAGLAAHLLQQHFGNVESLPNQDIGASARVASHSGQEKGAAPLPRNVRMELDQETLGAEWTARLHDFACGCLSSLAHLALRSEEVGIALLSCVMVS